MNKWRKYNGALVPDMPPHVEVDAIGIENKIKKENVFFARWTTDFDCKMETEFWHVICDEKLDMSDYSRNTRSKIRRGLKSCDARKITKEILISKGYDSYAAAFSKYNTHLIPKTLNQFQEEINSYNNSWDFWGIYHKDYLIGYSQNKVVDDYCDYSTIKFHPEYLKLYPSYALFYTMNNYYLNEKCFRYVNDGARSISHKTNIQEYLIDKFRFRKAFCKLKVIYSPRIRVLLILIFPFRFFIKLMKFSPFQKINILIRQEEIRRSYEG